MVSRSPGNGAAGVARHGGIQRSGTPGDLHVVTSNEAAAGIGLVEFLGQDAAGRWAFVAVEALLEPALSEADRMEHQVLADQTARVGEPFQIAIGG